MFATCNLPGIASSRFFFSYFLHNDIDLLIWLMNKKLAIQMKENVTESIIKKVTGSYCVKTMHVSAAHHLIRY